MNVNFLFVHRVFKMSALNMQTYM